MGFLVYGRNLDGKKLREYFMKAMIEVFLFNFVKY